MSEIIKVIMHLSVLTFVITSMLAMGLSLTIKAIVTPLRNTRVVFLSLATNFVLVPLLAYLILQVLPLEQGLATGLIIMSTAAGEPFLPKLAEVAKGNMAYSVGLMVLLMVGTILFMPLVLPLLLTGVDVDALAIAKSLVLLMLTPLAIGLFIKARYDSIAESLRPSMDQTSTVALVLLMVSAIVLNFSTMIGVIGTGGILAILIFLVVAFVFGYFLGGPSADTKSVLALGTAQRNVSAALLVAAQNFSDDPNVLTMILVTGLIGLVLLMVTGGELGKRN